MLAVAACADPEPPPEPTVEATLVATLASDSAPGFTQGALLSPSLPDGSYLGVETWAMHESRPIRMWPDGRASRLGRIGAGPGEYRRPALPMWSLDSLVIFDMALGRATVVVGDSAVRSFPAPAMVYSGVGLADGSFAVTSARAVTGPQLIHLSRTGEELGRFGEVLGEENGGDFQWFSPEFDGRFWTIGMNTCALQEWIGPGNPGRHVTLCGGRVVMDLALRRRDLETPPPHRTLGGWESPDGLFWIIEQVPDPRWQQALTRTEGSTEFTIAEPGLYYDVMLEAWDLATGMTVASTRFDWSVASAIAPGLVASHTQDDEGWFIPSVWIVGLRDGGD